MASTPDRSPPLVLVIGGVLIIGGIGLIVFALLASSESARRPAPTIGSALEKARPARGEFAGLTETSLALGDDCLQLVIADTTEERSLGLRGRETIGPYDGMLFVNEDDTTSGYTMAGVTVPLDIGWYSRAGEPVDRAEMEPCPEAGPECPLYSSSGSYRFGVETLRGELPSGALSGCSG